MDELGFYVPSTVFVILRRWKGEHERLCAMKRRLGSARISPPAGFEPATQWSKVGSANHSATRTLQTQGVGWEAGWVCVCVGGGGYSHIGTVRVCAPESPPFLALACAARKNPSFKKKYMCLLLFLAPNPLFFTCGPVLKAPHFQ